MPGFYDDIDLRWDDNGDFLVNDIGDLDSTEDDTIESVASEIRSIVNSSTGDWENYPTFAADLKDFIGEPNTPEIAGRIEHRVRSSIANAGVASMEDVSVRVVPITYDGLLILISLSAMVTSSNSLEENGEVIIAFIFDLAAGGTMFMEEDKIANRFPVGETKWPYY